MILVNILPEGKKEEIRRKKRFADILYQGCMVFFSVAAFLAILVGMRLVQSVELSSLEIVDSFEETQQNYQELVEYEKKFTSLNDKITTISSIDENHLYWSRLFEELSRIHESGVSIESLSTNDYVVSFTGKAATRDNFLRYKEKLSGSGCFENVNVPLSNLVEKEDISFQIDFRIKPECLRS